MNKLRAFVRLDFATVAPYFTPKNLLLCAAVMLFLLFTTSGGAFTATLPSSMGVVFAVLFVGYPFAIGEKSNMDALYVTLSLTRKTVVAGRYLFALALDACVVAMLLALTAVSLLLTGAEATGAAARAALAALAGVFALAVVAQAVQMPFYFRFGYSKAKIASLPFFIIMALFLTLPAALTEGELAGYLSRLRDFPNIGGITALAAASVALIFFGSYRLSLSLYKRREF
ncbi:MAG: ABC-2 transporter permease [Oscillospiraceae bacterium]|jgi:hypothetical protein|nr:ABC-2 transporter permease [Oscillospiraceae bacterium]